MRLSRSLESRRKQSATILRIWAARRAGELPMPDEKKPKLQRRPVKIQNPVPRICLCCDSPFVADGKYNRLCTPCKGSTVFSGQDQTLMV